MPRVKFVKKAKPVPHRLMAFFHQTRESEGWTQLAVAAELRAKGHSGTQSMLSDLESGVTRSPRLDTAVHVFEAMNYRIRVQVFNEQDELVFTWLPDGDREARQGGGRL